MFSPSEQLAAAKAANTKNRPYMDVEVLLDAGLNAERSALLVALEAAERLAASNQRLAGGVDPAVTEARTKLDAVLEQSKSALQTIRFLRATPTFWSDVTSRCPARPGAPVDEHYGYNMAAATQVIAPRCAGWLIDGEVVPLRVEKATEDSPAIDEWADLFATISPGEFAEMESAVFELNVYGPAMARQALKKELATRPA